MEVSPSERNSESDYSKSARFKQRFYNLLGYRDGKCEPLEEVHSEENDNTSVKIVETNETVAEQNIVDIGQLKNNICRAKNDELFWRSWLTDNTRQVFYLQLELIKLNTGSRFILPHTWKLIKYDRATKIYSCCSKVEMKGQLEDFILYLRNEDVENEVNILLKDGYSLYQKKRKILAFQVLKSDKYGVYKTLTRLVCFDAANYAAPNIKQWVNIYGMSYSQVENYCTFKLYLLKTTKVNQSYLLDQLQRALADGYSYLIGTMEEI